MKDYPSNIWDIMNVFCGWLKMCKAILNVRNPKYMRMTKELFDEFMKYCPYRGEREDLEQLVGKETSNLEKKGDIRAFFLSTATLVISLVKLLFELQEGDPLTPEKIYLLITLLCVSGCLVMLCIYIGRNAHKCENAKLLLRYLVEFKEKKEKEEI